MFFHFHSCSLSLLGAQNLIFLGLNFVTISLDSSFVKNQFFGPISGLFFSFFLIFCSFLHFFGILMFFIFSFFPKKKVSSFLFSCISFKKIFIAGVSIRV